MARLRLPLLLALVLAGVDVFAAAPSGYWVPGPSPPASVELVGRYGHAMAFDSARGRVVMFGGEDDYQPLLDDTWEYDGASWVRAALATSPEGRTLHAMAFDSARSRVILFGGDGTFAKLNDTWEYDGSTWMPGASAPPALTPRSQHATAFDTSRGKVVLFGGYDTSSRKDVWEYDGSAWTAGVAAPASLTARYAHAMGFDSTRSRVVLFGGEDITGLRKDTWEYDGGSWVAGPAAPAALTGRVYHALAFDSARGRTVLFAGYGPGYRDDTWEYDGSAWTPGPTAPPGLEPRYAHAMAFDSFRGRVVVFAGEQGYLPWGNDTWEFDGVAWVPGAPTPHAFSARMEHGMAFDTLRGRTVLFGGRDSVFYRDDTWESDGTAWVPGAAAPQILLPRFHHAMTYDSARGRTVLFGGVDVSGFATGTWEHDGASWIQGPPPPAGVAERQQHAMVFDAVRSRMVLFGGESNAGIEDETWEYDGVAWVQGPSAPPGLGPRTEHGMAFDAGRSRTVLFGGCNGAACLADTWEYDGSAWTAGPAAPALLTARFGHAMAYDAAFGRVLLHGGYDGSRRDDTWEYDGLAWSAGGVAPGGMDPRVFHKMVYDASRGRAVIVGGESVPDLLNDTWEYVACPPIAIAPPSLPAGSLSVPYSQTLAASGGSPPFSYAVPAGALPPGLALSPAGVISGTPAAPGFFAFTVSATDDNGCTGSRSYTLLIECPAITIAPPSLPSATEGIAYSQILTASGGTAPYAFAVASGTLPPGLALYPQGILSGMPTTPGIYAFKVRVTDDLGCRGSRTYAIAVGCPVITLGPPSLPDAVRDDPYAQLLSASGGVAPYTFALIGGALPPGLTLATTGLLAGTPTLAGTYLFDVAATDTAGCAGSRPYSIEVASRASYIAGPGPGMANPNRVRVFESDGTSTPVDFLAYGSGAWGTEVSSGDVDGSGGDSGEILTGPGPGPVLGPQVRGFDRSGAAVSKVNFYAYGTLRHGVNVGGGNIDGDGYDEIVSGPGPGEAFGPHVRAWNYDGVAVGGVAKVSFYAYATLRFGVNVAAQDLDGDGYHEILTGPGPGAVFTAQVRGWDYDDAVLRAMTKVNFIAFTGYLFGARVAAGDVDGDAIAEMLVALGPGPTLPARFVGFDYDAIAVGALPGFDIVPFASVYGGRVGVGDLSGEASADLVAGAGPDAGADSTVRAFSYTGSALTPTSPPFIAFGLTGYGVNVAAGMLGW